MLSEEPFLCPDCETTECLFINAGKRVCLNCGLVTDISIIQPSVKNFEINTTSESYVREKINKPIHASKKDVSNILLNGVSSNSLASRWKNFAKVNDSIEENIVEALTEVTRIGSLASLPIEVIERASTNFRKLLEKRTLKGHKVKEICAASIYIACRQCKHPISMGNIARVSGLKKKSIGKGLKLIIRELKISIPSRVRPYWHHQNSSSQITQDEASIITKILKAASKAGITIGKNPDGLSASAHYIASHLTGEIRTQRELSEIYNITQTTIRNRYKELLKCLSISIKL